MNGTRADSIEIPKMNSPTRGLDSPKSPNSPVTPNFNRKAPFPKSPLVATRSDAVSSERPRPTMERFLSVEPEPQRTRRRSGGGKLQDLSGAPSGQDGYNKPRARSLINNLLQPINYVRRRSMSRESYSSGNSDDSGSSSGSRKAEVVKPRRGSQNIFAKIAGASPGSFQAKRRASDSDKASRRSKKKGSGKKRDSLQLTKEKKAAVAREELKNRKPDVSTLHSETSNGSHRKDSIDVLKVQQEKKLSLKKKPKLSKRKSLGEALSLKLPHSLVMRRNSIDAFSLRNIFSLSRKNSSEDLKDSDDDTPIARPKHDRVGKLKAVSRDLQRRHSHGAADKKADHAYVYKPVSRPRTNFASLGLDPRVTPATSISPKSSAYDEFSSSTQRHNLGRRASGPMVVVSPASGSSSARESSDYNSSSDVTDSWSHSEISDLGDSDDGSSGSESDGHAKHAKHVRPRSAAAGSSVTRDRSRERSKSGGNSLPCSSAEEDCEDSDSLVSSCDENDNDRSRNGKEAEKAKENEEVSDQSPQRNDFYNFLEAKPPPVHMVASSDEEFFNIYDEYLFDDEGRRNSGEERSKSSTGSLTSVYIRGVDPVGAAAVFRDSRGLPQADSLKYCFDQEEESQILVKFFKLHRSYDLIPTSAKLVIFDTSLQVKKAFYALVHNGVRAAPLWDHERQRFVGMLTITDFIRILHSFHHNRDPQMEVLEEHRLHMWRTFLKDENRPLVSISPDESLFDAIRTLCLHKIHRLPVVDPSTGNVLYIITHKRILKFLYLYINELPKPLVLQKTVGELELGTYTNIETATPQTLIIEALDKFVKHRISALPIVDEEGKLLDIYAKFDVINLAAGGTYNKLDVTLAEANEYRNEWFEGVLHCNRSEKLCTIMDRIVRAEVHRLVVVDDDKKVIGVVSLSDILNELVLKPSELSEKLASPLASPITDLEGGVEGGNATPAPPTNELTHEPPQTGTSPPVVPPFPCLDPLSLGDSEDEGQYSMEKSE